MTSKNNGFSIAVQSLKTGIFLLLMISAAGLQAQTDPKAEARKIGTQAIRIMDEGKIDEAIKMLEEAEKLDPESYMYPYEVAYAYHLKKEDEKAKQILRNSIATLPVIDAQTYSLLGNLEDIGGNPDKAIEVYNEGLKKFPDSGILYLELGVVKAFSKEQINEALECWETGIQKDPAYPSNYYWAAKVYCASDQRLWGVLYGEIFMNIERGTERTAEISALLYETYKSAVEFKGKSEIGVSFCKNNVISVSPDQDAKDIKLPFSMIYEMKMLMSATMMSISKEKKAKTLDLATLCDLRSSFIEQWFAGDTQKDYPNILFDYLNMMSGKKHLNAYNHWLFMKGDEDAFDKWASDNKDEFERFVRWYGQSPMEVDKEHSFHRTQY